MATPQSAGRTLAVPERTGRTTHDRDPATTDRAAAGLRTTGHRHPDRAAVIDLDVPNLPHVPNAPHVPSASHVPNAPHARNAPRAKKPTAPHADKTLPHDIGRAGNRTGHPARVA